MKITIIRCGCNRPKGVGLLTRTQKPLRFSTEWSLKASVTENEKHGYLCHKKRWENPSGLTGYSDCPLPWYSPFPATKSRVDGGRRRRIPCRLAWIRAWRPSAQRTSSLRTIPTRNTLKGSASNAWAQNSEKYCVFSTEKQSILKGTNKHTLPTPTPKSVNQCTEGFCSSLVMVL